MDEYRVKYPIIKNQDSLWDIIQERKKEFVCLCLDKGIPEDIVDYIISAEFHKIKESGLIGCYYILYNAIKNADILKEDIGECNRDRPNALKYILGFITDIEEYIEELADAYDEDEKSTLEERFSYVLDRYVYNQSISINVAQTKYNKLLDEIDMLYSESENFVDLIGNDNYEYAMSLPDDEKDEEIMRLASKAKIFQISIQGNNLIGKDKVDYVPGKIIKDYVAKWNQVQNKINDILADNIKENIKFAFEVYLENGDASGEDGQLVEYPVLSIYISKKLIMTQFAKMIKDEMEMLEAFGEASKKYKNTSSIEDVSRIDDNDVDVEFKEFLDKFFREYKNPIDIEIISKLASVDKDDELYKLIMNLPYDVVSYMYDNCTLVRMTKIGDLSVYRKEYDYLNVSPIRIRRYDLVYSINNHNDDYVICDVIDFDLIDKYLDKYIEDTNKGIIYDSLDYMQDRQYHMYSVLNTLDKRINKEIVAEIYNKEAHDYEPYFYNGAVKEMSWMRSRTEGIFIPGEWDDIYE